MDPATSMSDDSDEEERYSFSSDVPCDPADIEREKEITALLAAAGPVGVAAAAAILSSKGNCSYLDDSQNPTTRRKMYSFETNPSKRKRQQNRLLRKLKRIVEEFGTRIGRQIVVLIATPNEGSSHYNCFGTQPLQNVIKNLKDAIMQDLEKELFHTTMSTPSEGSDLFELPPLVIDGIPTPLEKMTQGHLRAFIPMMLKYSTGRSKPGWGKENMKPPWWPKELPWANVRMDSRLPEVKQSTSWTHALREIIINCYKFHGRDDLLKTFPLGQEENKDEASFKCDTSTPEASTGESFITTLTNSINTLNQHASPPQTTSSSPSPSGQLVPVAASSSSQIETSTDQINPTTYQMQVIKDNCNGQEILINISSLSQIFNAGSQIILVTNDGEQTVLDGETQLIYTGDGDESLKEMFAFPVTSIQQVPASTDTDGALCYAFGQIPSKVKGSDDEVDDLISCDNFVDTASAVHEAEGVVPQLVQVFNLNQVN